MFSYHRKRGYIYKKNINILKIKKLKKSDEVDMLKLLFIAFCISTNIFSMQIYNLGSVGEEYGELLDSLNHERFKDISFFISKVDGEKNEINVKKQNLVVHFFLRLGFTVYHDRPNLGDFDEGIQYNPHSIKDGTDVYEFMDNAKTCDYFVALYTEEYLKKSELDVHKSSGVRYEIDICRKRLKNENDILVGFLLDGSVSKSIPEDLSRRLYRASSCIEEILAATLYVFLDSILPNINILGFNKDLYAEKISTFLQKWFPCSLSYSPLNTNHKNLIRGIKRESLENEIKKIIEMKKIPYVVGLAGSGKTVLAKRASFQIGENETYEINCSSDIQISLGLRLFAKYLFSQNVNEPLPSEESDDIKYIEYLKNVLMKKTTKMVIILDDFLSPHLITDLYAQNHFENVFFIITSRNENFDSSSIFEVVRMKELDSEEKRLLFYSECPILIDQLKKDMDFLEKIPSFPLDVVAAARYKTMHINNNFQSILSKVNNRESLLRGIFSNINKNKILPILFLIRNKNISLFILEKYSSIIESADSFYSLIWQLKRYSIMYESENFLHIHDEVQQIGLPCILEKYSPDDLIDNLKSIIKHTTDHPQEFDLRNKMLDFCVNLECMLANLEKVVRPDHQYWNNQKLNKIKEILLHNIAYCYFNLRLYQYCYNSFARLMNDFPSSDLSLINNFSTIGLVVRSKNAEKFTNDFLIEGDKRHLFSGKDGLLIKIKLMIATLYHTMYFDKTYLQIKKTENKFDEICELINNFSSENPQQEEAIFNLDRVKYYFYALVHINGQKLENWIEDAEIKISKTVSRLNEYKLFSTMIAYRIGILLTDKKKLDHIFEAFSKDAYFKSLLASIKLNLEINEIDELNDKARNLEDNIFRTCNFFSKSINKTGVESLRLTLFYSDLMFRTKQIEKGINFLSLLASDILEKVESRKLSNYNLLQCSQFFYDGYMFFLLSNDKAKSLAWFHYFMKSMDNLCQSYYDIHQNQAAYENLKTGGDLYAEKSSDYDDIFKNLENRNEKARKLFRIFFVENHEYIENHIKRSILAEQNYQELTKKRRRVCSIDLLRKSFLDLKTPLILKDFKRLFLTFATDLIKGIPIFTNSKKFYLEKIKENRMRIDYSCKNSTFYIDASILGKIDMELYSDKFILRSLPYDEQSNEKIRNLFYELRTCPVAARNYANGPLKKIEDINSQQIHCLESVQKNEIEIEKSLNLLRELEAERSNVKSVIDANIKIHESEREKMGPSFIIYLTDLTPIGFVRAGIIEVDVTEAMILFFPKLENVSKILSFDPAIMLLKEFHGCRFGSEIINLVINILFPIFWTLNIDNKLDSVNFLYATASAENEKSIALIKKNGGVFIKNDGVKNHYLAQLNQKKIDLSSFSIR